MGKTISEVYSENKAYEDELKRVLRLEEEEARGKTFVQEFYETNSEMMEFIAQGSEDNSFLRSMKEMIEEMELLLKDSITLSGL